MQNKEKEPRHQSYHLIPYIKIDSKWNIDLNVKHKTVKFLEENIKENLCDLVFGDQFLATTPKTQPMTEKVDYLDFY